jgi:Leucine-rich repeat (LRR) protein
MKSKKNVKQCVELEALVCEENGIINLDLSKNTNLIELRCRGNQLTSIDLRKNQALQVFDCEYNGLINLMFGNQSNLKEVQYEEGNRIKESTKRWIEKLKCNDILYRRNRNLLKK